MVTRRYGTLTAVETVSLSVQRGEIVGLLGPNGAGKTTIMKVLTGFHFAHGGTAMVDSIDLSVDPGAAKARIGYLPESAPVYAALTVSEYLEFIAGAHSITGAARRTAVDRVVHLCSLEEVFERQIDELSKGFRQRVGLAQALIHDPSNIILDEPTSGLDPNQIQGVREIIRDLGRSKSVLLSTHILSEVEALCDRVLIIDRGRIVAEGTPDEIARGLRGASLVEFEFVGTPAAAAREALGAIGDVVAFDERPDGARVRLALEDGVDGSAVFDWAVHASVRLRSLVPGRYSLEEIFARLTAGGAR
ncbi:MAG: ABC transporter ATP-binding protein [Spirochaetota bacterium]